MTLTVNIVATNNVSNFKKVEVDEFIHPIKEDTFTKEALEADFKESLNQAYDILEGKKPRRTISDMING